METINDSSVLFPNLFEQEIVLGKLGWKWGDISSSEMLIFLCLLAKYGYSPVVEFGTFRGRTTYNLALNSRQKVYTIDVGDSLGQKIDMQANIEKHEYPRYKSGELFLFAPDEIRNKIQLIIGDSRQLNLTELNGLAGMVIVDGGHSYEVCKSDSEKALQLVRKGGLIVWDDYDPYWPGVIKALDELSARIKLYHLVKEHLVVHMA